MIDVLSQDAGYLSRFCPPSDFSYLYLGLVRVRAKVMESYRVRVKVRVSGGLNLDKYRILSQQVTQLVRQWSFQSKCFKDLRNSAY